MCDFRLFRKYQTTSKHFDVHIKVLMVLDKDKVWLLLKAGNFYFLNYFHIRRDMTPFINDKSQILNRRIDLLFY